MYAGLAAFAKHLLTMPGAPLYLDNTDVANGLWLGHITESDDVLDAEGIHGATALDVEVLTGDAAGRMGGGWWRTERMAFEFPIEQQAPNSSSNFREFATSVQMLKHWGEQLRGRRVLIRTDNITTAACINKRSSKFDTLRPLVQELLAVTKEFDLDVRASHCRAQE